MKIETLLFDLGKVIIDFNVELGMQHFAASCPLPRKQFEEIMFDKNWIGRYERGEISTAEYHRYLCETGSFRMGLAEFHDSWSSVFLPDLIVPEALLASLKQRYPLILVSNTNESHVDYIARKYPVFQYFTHKIFSHEVGSMKPDRKIYDAAIAAAGKPPEALFFIDDRLENIEAAGELGIRGHQFTSVPALVESLHQHGIDTGGFVHSGIRP